VISDHAIKILKQTIVLNMGTNDLQTEFIQNGPYFFRAMPVKIMELNALISKLCNLGECTFEIAFQLITYRI